MAALVTYSPPSDKIIHETDADFVTRDGYGKTVYVTQGDVKIPVIAVHMYQNGQPYAVPENAFGNIRWKKPNPDRHFVYNPLLGVDETRTIAYFEVTDQMSVTPGFVDATIEIMIGSETTNSERLPIIVNKNPIKDVDLESTDEAKSLAGLVDSASTSAKEAQGSATKAEESASNAKQSAQEAAESKEAASTSASQAATSAEASEESANNSKSSADSAAKSAESAKQYSGKPAIPGDNQNWWIWDAEAGEYIDSGDRALLNYDVTYSSIAEMEADAENQKPGIVAIISTDVEIEDNAKTYVKRKDGTWGFLADLSGFPGVGFKDQINPETPAQPGQTDIYKLRWTDGRETELKVYNGKDGTVLSVNGQTGEVTLTAIDVGTYSSEEIDSKVISATSKNWDISVPSDGWVSVADPAPTWNGYTAVWENVIPVEGIEETTDIKSAGISFVSGDRDAAGQWRWLESGDEVITLYSDLTVAPTADFVLNIMEVK